jgi:hypothetical protein
MRSEVKSLPRFSFGMGDRFGAEGTAQLSAILEAQKSGIEVTPVWNKSHREHSIIGTEPMSLRLEADAAVRQLGWTGDYFVDADHINLETVAGFAASSDFFTIDVADSVGQPAPAEKAAAFLEANACYVGVLPIPGKGPELTLTKAELEKAAAKFLAAIEKAGAIYRRIVALKEGAPFATEVSIDETDEAQSPGELFCILAMIAAEGIPAQTVAPKFTGRFNKGVDYVGDLTQFEREFDADLHILQLATKAFGLPENLKLSVHSGSDKFSLYPVINKQIKAHGAGLHVKTAGTTWLEEVIGLAQSEGDGLVMAKEIYSRALTHAEALCGPYRTVIDIDPAALPSVATVESWSAESFTSALRHDRSNPHYNPHLRQLLHVGFKIAAQMGPLFLDALELHREVIAQNVTTNLLHRHICPLFTGA